MKKGLKRDNLGRLDGHMRDNECRAKNKKQALSEVNEYLVEKRQSTLDIGDENE